jgi:hypothetical protein
MSRLLFGDARRYQQAIERLYQKYQKTGRVQELLQDGASLAQFHSDRARLSKILAKAVVSGDYRFCPARLKTAKLEGKERILFAFELTDWVVHDVFAKIMTELMEPLLPECLYSYRKGWSTRNALESFSTYVREHRRSRPHARDRGFFVLKRDVKSYTDTIPVSPGSDIWPQLARVLNRAGEIDPRIWSLLEEIVRPRVFSGDRKDTAAEFQFFRGVPTGSPIATVLFNLYLLPLDQLASEFPGSFYFRYGDDFLFAHENAEVVEAASRSIDILMENRGLSIRLEKRFDYFFNGAGRPSEAHRRFKGVSQLNFLGWKIGFDGAIGLSEKKLKKFRHDMRERIYKTAQLLARQGLSGQTLCEVINEALSPGSEFVQGYLSLLLIGIDDRRQLKDLDHWLARLVSRASGGASYRVIRKKWALKSLVVRRNQGR